MPRGSGGQIFKDEARATDAFDLQVEAQICEEWLRPIWTDAFLRGFYAGKLHRDAVNSSQDGGKAGRSGLGRWS